MADPVVRRRRGGEDDEDPRERMKASESPPATGDAPEEADAEPESQSLFEPPVPTDADNPYGRPGPPISRSSAFYKGFVGALGVAIAIALVFAFQDALEVLELVLVAVVLSIGLNPIVELAIRRGIKRGWAVLGVAVLVAGVLTAVVIIVGGVLRDQIVTLIDDAPKLLNDLRKNATIRHLDQKYHIISDLEQKLRNPNFLTDYFGGVFNVGLSVLRGVAGVVIVFILTLYFLSALPSLKRNLYSLAPASRRTRVAHLGDEILRRVGRYVIGAFLVACLAGTVSLLFMLSVGLSAYALPLALMVALLDLVPLVGSILGASIVSLVGFANSLPIGIACVVFYVIYETLEGYVIYPRVMRSSVDVPEYVTIIAVLVGGAVGGIVGALLALPIGAAILLLIREVWVRRQDVS
jgi:predicted PurR-regulated permease PerM